MEYFLQQLINGVTLGAIYGLIAIGYTMVYGIIGMINFAHGDVFMVGAFIALIAFLCLVAIGVTAVPLALFLVLLDRHGADRALRLDRRALRLPSLAPFLPAGPADLGHRHVDRRWRTTCRSRKAPASSRCRR